MDDIRYIAHMTVRPACSARLCALCVQPKHIKKKSRPPPRGEKKKKKEKKKLLLGLIESDLIRGVSDKRRDIKPATRRTVASVILAASRARETR